MRYLNQVVNHSFRSHHLVSILILSRIELQLSKRPSNNSLIHFYKRCVSMALSPTISGPPQILLIGWGFNAMDTKLILGSQGGPLRIKVTSNACWISVWYYCKKFTDFTAKSLQTLVEIAPYLPCLHSRRCSNGCKFFNNTI